MARKNQTPAGVVELLKREMDSLTLKERKEVVRLVLADPEFYTTVALQMMLLDAARVHEKGKNSHRSKKPYKKLNEPVIADRLAELSYQDIALKHHMKIERVRGIIRRWKESQPKRSGAKPSLKRVGDIIAQYVPPALAWGAMSLDRLKAAVDALPPPPKPAIPGGTVTQYVEVKAGDLAAVAVRFRDSNESAALLFAAGAQESPEKLIYPAAAAVRELVLLTG